MPIRFQQTTNETSAAVKTDPAVVPFTAANGSGVGEAEMAVYSEVPGATDNQNAHTKFLLDAAQVARWMPAVIGFVERNLDIP